MDELKSRLKGDTGRLAATYLAIIMGLTIMFSGVIYAITASQFDRPLPRGQMGGLFRDAETDYLERLFERRAAEARAELFLSLLMLNLTVLIAGGVFSYYLARKSLEPIERAMEAQSRFISDASHELRTPLTALQVTNEVALRKKKLSLADAKELIGHNLAETIKLRTLSESLLGLARQEGMAVNRTDVDVGRMVDESVGTFTSLAAARDIAFVSEVPSAVISADASAVSQVLRVFLDNAIKYAPTSSTVTITFNTTDDEHQLAVHDDGPGIPVSNQARIFDRFYRIDESRSSQNQQGTGLGLAIAKAAAERQGYRVSLKAGEHEGNTFILHIPIS